ncbi:hypothetical protein [Thalassobellus suaedae]|uniref:Lipoprotein n=1 Tax=Thalassobellus suaedae TaxID=3074124 RepID=A0ABY9XYT0_9FLAO|nr:hypothetical protein RHP51_09555 [Flavobacteriaceae bacterium HL-DH14]
MNKKFKISFLILICFTLMSCPAAHFYDYEYNGISKKENYGYSRILYSEKTDIIIKCGFFVTRIGRVKGLAAFIQFDNKLKNINKSDISINSSTYGALSFESELAKPTASDFDSDFTFKIPIESGSERKILKRIKNDTITIKIKGKVFEFIKKE